MSHYYIGKYKYPGTGWYVLLNGHICSSGTSGKCRAFIKRNQEQPHDLP